jgi:hypothetical protein
MTSGSDTRASSAAAWYARKPDGRFNDWGERKWLRVTPEQLPLVDNELRRLELSPRARSLYWSASLTDSSGVEFVLISNAQFVPVIFEGSGVHIVPCFTPMDPGKPRYDKRHVAMTKRGEFIYDGWVPCDVWTASRLEQIVSSLDDIASLVSLTGGYYAHWEPKYPSPTSPIPWHVATQAEFEAVATSIAVMAQLPQADKLAIRRSLAWVAAALMTPPLQRFLLLFVSFESLATYIEGTKTSDASVLRSAFAADKPSKSRRKRRRKECVQRVFANSHVTPRLVERAYWECVGTSIREMLEDHINRVLTEPQVSRLLFVEKVGGKTLWELRNDIAHGSLYILSDQETQLLSRRVPVLESVVRRYLTTIFSNLARRDYFPRPRTPNLTLPASHAFGSRGTDYAGPTDMAEYYANVEALSASYVRMGPQ